MICISTVPVSTLQTACAQLVIAVELDIQGSVGGVHGGLKILGGQIGAAAFGIGGTP